ALETPALPKSGQATTPNGRTTGGATAGGVATLGRATALGATGLLDWVRGGVLGRGAAGRQAHGRHGRDREEQLVHGDSFHPGRGTRRRAGFLRSDVPGWDRSNRPEHRRRKSGEDREGKQDAR